MAPLEPWEKALVNEAFTGTVHGAIPCTECHGGQQEAGKEAAHTGLIAVPSADPGAVCGACHAEIVETYPNSLHSTQQGYWTVIEARSAPEDHPALEEMFGNHCASCHTDCGDCHVSQPTPVGGGFIDGHLFNATPSITRNCTACHGSRVGNEYLGKHEGLKADVHFRKGRMKCTDCHTAAEMHGDYAALGMDETPDHRYAGGMVPTCTSCHDVEAMSTQKNIVNHKVHGQVACQVCHSVAYTSCDGCHVQVSEESGKPYFSTEGSYLTFFIGQNPLKSSDRPYEYVTLRHVPVATTSYSFYGANMPNFDALPTWVYATPHNIQLQTPQTESCDSCHGNADIFLTKDKVSAQELNANQSVIIEEIPQVIMDSFGDE